MARPEDSPSLRRWTLALAVFGVVFLPTLVVLRLASARVSTAFLAAGVVAALAGVASSLDDRIGRRIR